MLVMRIVVISDTHTQHAKVTVPDGDLLIHSGDFTMVGSPEDIISFNNWLGTLPHKHKVIIAGNHDFLFDRQNSLARSLITNAIYLENSGVEIEGYKIWGSPMQPTFMNWAFNRDRGPDIKRYWDMIPDDTQILITHGPPHGILDKIHNGDLVGCEELLECVKRIKPLIHVFGHIHEGAGTVFLDGTHFVNASILNEKYVVTHKPITVDI